MGRHSRSRSGSRSRSRGRGRGGYDAYDAEQDGYRVHVADLGIDCTQTDIEKSFKKYGEIKEIWLARNPPCFSFVVYKHRADGEEAIKDMDGRQINLNYVYNVLALDINFEFLRVLAGSRVRVSWARPRTKGRNRRFDPNMRCYQCGQKGHFSRDCNRSDRNYSDDEYSNRRRSRRRYLIFIEKNDRKS